MRLRALVVQGAVAALVAVSGPFVGRAGGATFNGPGFDTCGAPPASTMAAWLGSPYRAVGVYIGGINRACGDGNLSSTWITTVENQGWKLIPTYVGRQAACAFQSGLSTLDPATAASEGVAEADDAANRAAGFGLGPDTPIYFDMEAYGSDASCGQAVQAFLSAWTVQLHRRGYVSGVYGSSGSTIAQQAAIIGNCSYLPADAIWFANWDGSPTIFGDSHFPDSAWADHRRLHQYQGSHTEAFGPGSGIPLNVDSDYVDGPLAGPAGTASLRVVSGITGTPSVISSHAGPYAGTLSAYARGADGALYVTGQAAVGSCWQPWQRIGGGAPAGGIQGAPAAVATQVGPYAGILSAYAVGLNGALYTTWQLRQGGGWAGWYPIGGGLPAGGAVGSPTAVAASAGPYAGVLSAYVVAHDGGLYTTWQAGPGGAWAGWQRIGGGVPGGGIQGPLAVVAAAVGPYAGTLSAYATGADGALYTTWQAQPGGAWAGWQRIGGVPPPGGAHGAPAMVTPASGPYAGALAAYARGGDGGMYTTWQVQPGGLWAGWQRIGGASPPGGVQGSPSVVVSSRGPYNGIGSAYVRAGDGRMYTTWQASPGGLWVPWAPIGGPSPAGSISDSPTVIESHEPATPGALSLYSRAADASLYTTWQSHAGSGWQPWALIGWTMPAVA